VRDSADSYDPSYGRIRRGNRGGSKRQKFDGEDTYLKRDRHLNGALRLPKARPEPGHADAQSLASRDGGISHHR
jgi:hypothetical protein